MAPSSPDPALRGCTAVFDQFTEWISGAWWSYPLIFAVSMIDAFFPVVPSESVVITAGNLASSGDLWLLGVIAAAAGRGDRRRQHLVRDRQVRRRAHRQAPVPLRQGAPRLRVGRAAARAARLLHHRHRAVHPGRADGGHLLVRVHARNAVAPIHRRRRLRGPHLGDVRGHARLHRRQDLRGPAVEGPVPRLPHRDRRRRSASRRSAGTSANGARRVAPPPTATPRRGRDEPARSFLEPVPPPARGQPGRLVPVGRRGVRAATDDGSPAPGLGRLQLVPLVPRHGARVVL